LEKRIEELIQQLQDRDHLQNRSDSFDSLMFQIFMERKELEVKERDKQIEQLKGKLSIFTGGSEEGKATEHPANNTSEERLKDAEAAITELKRENDNLLKVLNLKIKDYLILPVEEVNRITNNFKPENKIGDTVIGEQFSGKFAGISVIVTRVSPVHFSVAQKLFAGTLGIQRLSHPNLLPFLGQTDCYQQTQCFVHPVAINGNLRDRLDLLHFLHPHQYLQSTLETPPAASKVVITWFQRLRIARQIVSVLSYIHSLLKVDQDAPRFLLTSKSVGLSDGFDVKISILDVISAFGQPKNPGYFSPEFFVPGASTEKSMVYSFGVILGELLFGAPPFTENADGTVTLLSTQIQKSFLSLPIDPHLFSILTTLRSTKSLLSLSTSSSSSPIPLLKLAGEDKFRILLQSCLEIDPQRRPTLEMVDGVIHEVMLAVGEQEGCVCCLGNSQSNAMIACGHRILCAACAQLSFARGFLCPICDSILFL